MPPCRIWLSHQRARTIVTSPRKVTPAMGQAPFAALAQVSVTAERLPTITLPRSISVRGRQVDLRIPSSRNRLTLLVAAFARLPIGETPSDARAESMSLPARYDALDPTRPGFHGLGFVLFQFVREFLDIISLR